MPQTTVNTPNGPVTIDHPEGATDEQILRFAKQQFEQTPIQDAPTQNVAPARPPSVFDRLNRTPAFTGLAEVGASLGSGLFAEPAAGLAGLVGLSRGPDFAAGVVEAARERGTFQPRTQPGKDILQGIGSVVEPAIQSVRDAIDEPRQEPIFTGALGLGATQPGTEREPTARSPAVSTALETTLLGTPAIFGGRAIARSPLAQSISTATVAQPGAVIPTVREVFAAGKVAFDRARQLGGGVRPEALERAARSVREVKNDVGLKIDFDADLHPKATRVRQRLIEDFESGQVDFDELMTLRELASDVAASGDKAERFRGVILKNKIDDFVNSLDETDVLAGNPQAAAEALATARQLWRDASAARTIERHINLAGIDAGDFSGAGFENKLRIRFRQLARRIENGQERGFRPDEVRLINQVANGTFSGNIARFVGKFAPTGVVSGTLGAGAGLAIGGPLGAVAVPTIGALGRALGTRSTIRSAQQAFEAPLTNSLTTP